MPESNDAETARTEVAETGTPPSGPVALARWFLVISIVFVVIAVAAFWITVSLNRNPASSPAGTAADGGDSSAHEYPAPDFRLASLDGRTIGPPDFAGQAVVVDFWATWCGPCKLQAKMLDKLHEELDGKDVHFLAVNVGEDEETVRKYVDETPFPYSVLLDPEDMLSVRYQIYGLPTLMVIDRKGKVSFMRTGLTDVPTLRRELAKVGINV